MSPETFTGFLVVIRIILLAVAIYHWRAVLVGGLILGGAYVILEEPSLTFPVNLIVGFVWVYIVIRLFGTKG